MLYWALVFLVISAVSGLMGLNEVAGVTMDVAQFLFWGFLILAALFMVLAVVAGRKMKKMIS